MKKDEIILEGLGDSIGNEFTDLINIRVADIAFPARKTEIKIINTKMKL